MYEISFVVVFFCWSLLNPDLFLSVVLHFKEDCAILTHLCLLQDNINHCYSICFDHSAEIIRAEHRRVFQEEDNLMVITVYFHSLS